MNNKFCVSKTSIILALVLIIISTVIYISYIGVNSRKITSSRAEEPKTNIDSSKKKFTIQAHIPCQMRVGLGTKIGQCNEYIFLYEDPYNCAWYSTSNHCADKLLPEAFVNEVNPCKQFSEDDCTTGKVAGICAWYSGAKKCGLVGSIEEQVKNQ